LVGEIHDAERIMLLEDTSEIKIAKPHNRRCESQEAQQATPRSGRTISSCSRTRCGIDRIALSWGEMLNGPKAGDLLQAMNTGTRERALRFTRAAPKTRSPTRRAHQPDASWCAALRAFMEQRGRFTL
jgi:hypothetical protein